MDTFGDIPDDDDPVDVHTFTKPQIMSGRDVNKIPCFRFGLKWALVSSLAVGFGRFLLTSQGKRSAHYGFCTFYVVGFLSFTGCRISYERKRRIMTEIHDNLSSTLRYRGTKFDPEYILDEEPKPDIKDKII